MKNECVNVFFLTSVIAASIGIAVGKVCPHDVLIQLAIAYISAFIFWLLTVYTPGKKKRSMQKQLIYDVFITLKRQIEHLEDEIGHDRAFSLEDYKHFFLGKEGEHNCKYVHSKCESMKLECLRILTDSLILYNNEKQLLLSVYNNCYQLADSLKLPIIDEQLAHVAALMNDLFKAIGELDKQASKLLTESADN